MRIDQLVVKNFKGFKHREFRFHPRFNLIVGVNGTGKTSLLDALSVAVGSWFLGFSGCDTRNIRQSEVMLSHFGEKGWEPQHPCTVEATGEVVTETLSWSRSLNTPGGRTTYGEARNIKGMATRIYDSVRSGGDDSLPLISYCGTGRLWNAPREQAQVKNEQKIAGKEKLSRLEGYRNSVDPRLSVAELVRWIARQSWITFQKGGKQNHYSIRFKRPLSVASTVQPILVLMLISVRLLQKLPGRRSSHSTTSAMDNGACGLWWGISQKRPPH